MSLPLIDGTNKYYYYTVLTQLRFTKIVNILFIVQSLGLGLVKFALLQSIFLFSQLIFELPSGVLGDLLNKKIVVSAGLIILTTSPMLIYFTYYMPEFESFPVLILAFTLEGIGDALLSGTDDAIFFETIRDEHQEKRYGKIRGNIQLISAIAMGIATLTGGILYSVDQFYPFLFQSLMLLLALMIIASINNKDKVREANRDTNLMQNLRDTLGVFKLLTKSSNIFFLFVYSSIIAAVVNAFFGLLPEYISKIGFTSAQNGGIFMLFSLIGGLIATQAYRLSGVKLNRLIFTILLVLFLSLIFQYGGNKYVFLIGIGLIYIILDILDPIIMEMLHLWVSDKSRATVISGMSLFISLVTMIITPAMGLLIQKTNTIITGSFTAVLMILLTVTAYILLNKSRKKQKG